MPRSIWNGAISFGLVNVPVQLFSAVQQKDIHFHEFQEGTGTRIRHKRVSEKTGREVEYDKIEKGYETSRGKYVMLTAEELASVEPGKSRTIDIEDFVELAEIDPIYFEKPYFVVPQKGAEKPYALLRAAMERSERVAIARFVMRTKQYLAALRVADNVIVLETLYFDDEIRDTNELNVPHRQPADRQPHRAVEAGEVRGHLPPARARSHSPQGQGPGDRRRAPEGRGRAGARPLRSPAEEPRVQEQRQEARDEAGAFQEEGARQTSRELISYPATSSWRWSIPKRPDAVHKEPSPHSPCCDCTNHGRSSARRAACLIWVGDLRNGRMLWNSTPKMPSRL
jgi:Ku protein